MSRPTHSVMWQTAWVALLGLAVVSCPADGEDAPRLVFLDFQKNYIAARQNPPPLSIAPIYVKRATWHDSMRASLEATFGSIFAEADSLTMGGFRPAVVRLAADAAPGLLKLQVTDLERVYFAALGYYPLHGSAYFVRPRLFDKAGGSIDLTLDGTVVPGKVAAGEVAPIHVEIDGQAVSGFALSLGEIGFQLDGKYDRLEVSVCYQPQTELPPYAAVDCRPVCTRASEYRRTHEALWDLVARDFRDRQSQIEMEMERRDGIWNEYAPSWEGASATYYMQRARERLELARRTLELVERVAPQPELAAELAAMDRHVSNLPRAGEGTGEEGTGEARALFARAVDVRRRIIFAHPALNFERLLLAKTLSAGVERTG